MLALSGAWFSTASCACRTFRTNNLKNEQTCGPYLFADRPATVIAAMHVHFCACSDQQKTIRAAEELSCPVCVSEHVIRNSVLLQSTCTGEVALYALTLLYISVNSVVDNLTTQCVQYKKSDRLHLLCPAAMQIR